MWRARKSDGASKASLPNVIVFTIQMMKNRRYTGMSFVNKREHKEVLERSKMVRSLGILFMSEARVVE